MLSNRHIKKKLGSDGGWKSHNNDAPTNDDGVMSGDVINVNVKENSRHSSHYIIRRLTHNRWSMGLLCVVTILLPVFDLWGHQEPGGTILLYQSSTENGRGVAGSDGRFVSEARSSLDGHDHQTDGQPFTSLATEQQRRRKPTNHACDGYRGIYHINKGDIGGAAGTVFFQFVIAQIMWAEQYNFKPWVHMNNVSYVVYDPAVHGSGPGIDVTMKRGMNISYYQRPLGHWRDAYPGPPEGDESDLEPYDFHFDGDGVWENYFEPVSDFFPGDTSCIDKPLVTMDLYLITPGIHGFAPWAPKCWRYHYLPDYITKPHVPLSDWLAPQRLSANSVVQRYIRFLPHIVKKAKEINPDCSILDKNPCLGIHIRQSDKASGRRQIQTDEFLPFVQAFLKGGGKWVYVATDSGKVMTHIQRAWPEDVKRVIRSIGDDVVRSNGFEPVFEIGSHHRTNTEILIEILALSQCQFMIHGLSAVTESSIWINYELHHTSVNLEDPLHLNVDEFGDLVGRVVMGENATQIWLETRQGDWWTRHQPLEQPLPNNRACQDVDGILHISHVGPEDGTGTAFFTSILNQLIYAERNNLKPWIHLANESEYIYDPEVHGTGMQVIEVPSQTMTIGQLQNENNSSLHYPGVPTEAGAHGGKTILSLNGNGIWNSYFRPVSDFVPGDASCTGKPIVTLESEMVVPALNSWTPWSVKAWQYDDIPNNLWMPVGVSLKDWLGPMRRKASDIVKKYFHFHPFLVERAHEVNPVNSTSRPCLAVHLRNSDKMGVHRSKFSPNKFRNYFVAFARAGGKDIFVSSDSHRTLEFVDEHFPVGVRSMIRTQGPYVVRTSWKWPIHMLEKHHRTNSEALVDILAMSKCQLFLHGNSALSEAVIYLNPDLHNQSVNWEDPEHMGVEEFEALARRVLGTTDSEPVDISTALRGNGGDSEEDPRRNVTIVYGNGEQKMCQRNAIVYLAQKKHSSYGRDSFGILMKSLKLMDLNYLSRNKNRNNTDVIIFHTGDFSSDDMNAIEFELGSDFRRVLHFVDLYNTTYWQRPPWHRKDNQLEWYAFPLFSEGYRQMMHWFAIDIWRFFHDYGKGTGCTYEYIMRFDEDSFLHSPVEYDIFDYMKSNDFNYGFRLCAYEMPVTQRIWAIWRGSKGSPEPIREIDLEMCGIYNNFFVAKLSFFLSGPVQRFLKFVDRQGMIYRRRLGDLMIHSMTVYSFSPPEKIHRFLDFTYEHATNDTTSGCVFWGGIQAGYNDPNSDATLDNYLQERVISKGCTANMSSMMEADLSPTYQHIPDELRGKVKLRTIAAGKVELPGKGVLSG